MSAKLLGFETVANAAVCIVDDDESVRRALARQYGMVERRPYLNRSRSEVDKARGWQFS